ncbi:MAG TPA: ATP-binding protein, partial [Nitrosospira sp.]|nr:ATP-binding protein [Nitrosospira sp.]
KEDLDFYRVSGMRASQSTPLISREGRVVGILSTHWRDVHYLSDRELRLLDMLARQAADLIERKWAEEALRESDRRKDEFLATLAHELRNPLAPIKNGLQVARLSSQEDPHLQRTLGMMDRQLKHLVHLVDDLLDVARISSGKVELRRKPVSVGEVIARSIEASQPLIDAHQHTLAVDVGPEEVFVDGDIDRLSQVFSNLLSNGAKYTERGGHLRVSLEREENDAVVRVTDTGVGIPPEDLQRVFDLFSQVRSHQELAEGGLGIGLSLIRTLVEMHGGRVTAESGGRGAGSTFTVRLPLAPGNSVQTTSSPELSPVPTEALALRLLVVDDNVDSADSLAVLLEMNGHELEVANSGADALEKAQHIRFDIIFLDLGMPEMDGIETAKRLRLLPNGNEIFLVALTGWGQEKDRERTRAAGFDWHLVKPVESDVFMEVLARYRNQSE